MDNPQQILVVVGDSDTRNLVAALLRRIGLQAILVKENAAALTLLEEGLSPSLIILDLMAATVSGFETLEHLRRIPRLSTIPVLTLAAQADPEFIRRGLDAGADAYVTRPYIAHSLLDRVRVLLAGGRRPRPRTKFYGRTAPLTMPPLDKKPS